MIGSGPQNGFRVTPTTIVGIRSIAASLSEFLKIDDDIRKLNFGRLLDELSQYGITYDVLDAAEMPHANVEGCCFPQNLEIFIRRDVYENACNDEPRARFTVAHEFGHLFLGHQRTTNRETPGMQLKTYEDSEWQANQFAAEFLMPYHTIKNLNLTSVEQIMSHFNVSEAAAYRRFNQLKKRGEI